jgi:hypothetical protein
MFGRPCQHLDEKAPMMLKRYRFAAALISILGVSLPCAAQNAAPPNVPPGSAAPQTRDLKACAQGQGTGGTAPQTLGSGTGNLSDKLAQTDGVICPADVDPEIKAPTPPGGTMPVIPPPGSPGGDPSVRPK